MPTFLFLFLGIIAGLALVGWLADRRSDAGDKTVTPGLTLLPGDIKYESQDGRVKVYFPVVTSIVVSIVLSLVLSFFNK